MKLIKKKGNNSLEALYERYTDKVLIPQLAVLKEYGFVNFLYIEQQVKHRIVSANLTNKGIVYLYKLKEECFLKSIKKTIKIAIKAMIPTFIVMMILGTINP